ncbi:MAG: efflux RND transporter periplasmic adaptor subunit [Aeromonas sp.]
MSLTVRIITATLLLGAGAYAGYTAAPHLSHWLEGSASAEAEKKPLYWVNPMDPRDKRDGPAKDHMGMDFLPVYAEPKGAPGTVTISPAIEQNLGVRLAKVAAKARVGSLTTLGFVALDEEALTTVNARFAGWVRRLAARSEGQAVQAGDLLYEIYSPDLVNAQHEYLLALNSHNPLLLRAATGKLRALDVSDEHIAHLKRSGKVAQTMQVFAPVSGYVFNLAVREGQYVEPSTALLNLASLTQVWVSSEVFERQASALRVGDPVHVSSEFAPERRWQGVVDYIYPTLDATTRTLKLRVRLSNPEEVLKPNMFVNLRIEHSAQAPALMVPREAVIRTGQQDRVVLALGEGRYKSVAVTLAGQQGEDFIIQSGLEAGDHVVRSAQFMLDSESALNSDFLRMTAFEPVNIRPDTVWAKGTILAVDAHARSATVSHEPIAAWQWPAMEMDFVLPPSLDISTLPLNTPLEMEFKQVDDMYHLLRAKGGAATPATSVPAAPASVPAHGGQHD